MPYLNYYEHFLPKIDHQLHSNDVIDLNPILKKIDKHQLTCQIRRDGGSLLCVNALDKYRHVK